MGDSEEKRAIRNVPTFLSDGRGLAGLPMRTLSDEWHDEPPEPEDSDRVPEVDPPGLARRILNRLANRPTSSKP